MAAARYRRVTVGRGLRRKLYVRSRRRQRNRPAWREPARSDLRLWRNALPPFRPLVRPLHGLPRLVTGRVSVLGQTPAAENGAGRVERVLYRLGEVAEDHLAEGADALLEFDVGLVEVLGDVRVLVGDF